MGRTLAAIVCLVVGVLSWAAEPEKSAERLPVLAEPAMLVNAVDTAIGVKTLTGDFSSQDYWEGRILDPRDPILVLKPVGIDADMAKYLHLKLAAEHADSVQIFFGPDLRFDEQHSFRAHECLALRATTLSFDLSEFSHWAGPVRRLRIDFEGCAPGDTVRIHGVWVSEAPVTLADAIPIQVSATPGAARAKSERMAAWHHTLVVADERRPTAAVMTYALDRPSTTAEYVLAVFVPTIDSPDSDSPRLAGLRVEDQPGAVVGTCSAGSVRVRYELVPLMVGRDTEAQEGAALYRITTDPPTPITVHCGGRQVHNPHAPRIFLRPETLDDATDAVSVEDGVALITREDQPLAVAVSSTGELAAAEQGGSHVTVRFPSGSGDILIAYAADAADARRICALVPDEQLAAVRTYYDAALAARIETPEEVLDQAFRSAIYNLEYAWLKPYGWIESIHHWQTMWHMQASGAAQWIGQVDRARDCILSHAQRLLPNGGAPQLTATGDVHREIFTGGSNQFYAWQIRQYWDFTGDPKAAKTLGPVLERVVAQTFDEYDRDHDLLLRWEAQIGNQEDFIKTPYNGTTPSIEGMNMLRTAAALARVRGDEHQARLHEHRAASANSRLRAQLWQPDLGRFMYYRDPLGIARPDGQYHTLIYPAIWGILDPLDNWTSLRHLRDRLTGAGGEVYCSNNFPTHSPSTSGLQAGAAQQPWAAWGLAAVGLRNEAHRPLTAVARWVMDKNKRGAWPEIANEPVVAYFSPPAGLFIQATIEAIFGLHVNKPEGYLRVAPSFPDQWPHAKLHLPAYQAAYTRDGDHLEYTVESKEPLARHLRWLLPAGDIDSVRVDGRDVSFQLTPGVACILLAVDVPPSTHTKFEVDIRPWTGTASHPASIAEGDDLELAVTEAEIDAVDDRCGLLSRFEHLSTTRLTATIGSTLLQPYMGFGRLGLMNFSRRTFFVRCHTTRGTEFWLPVDLTILPRHEAAQIDGISLDNGGVTTRLLVRNNTSSTLSGEAWLSVREHRVPFTLDVPPRSEQQRAVAIPRAAWPLLSPGDNNATVTLPDGETIDLTLDASHLFVSNPDLLAVTSTRMTPIALPADDLKDPRQLAGLRNMYAYDWMGWHKWPPHLDGLAEDAAVSIPGLPAVSFQPADQRVVPVSWKSGAPTFTLDLGGRTCLKLYILALPYLENHDMFAPVARVTARLADGGIITRTLYSPGDLDWCGSDTMAGLHRTAGSPRPNRLGLLPLLDAMTSDWDGAHPPAFPQAEYWATSRVLTTPGAVLSVIELDLGRQASVESLTVGTIGVDPALGIVAITAECPDAPTDTRAAP